MSDGEITWLKSGNDEFVQRHDEEAYAQQQRNVHNMSEADGYIDLCKVTNVRLVHRGSSPADPNIGEGPAVDFQTEPTDSRRDDGDTQEFDDDRTFEMSLENGLVVRLQAYDAETRDEWVKRLDTLVKYWKMRRDDDAAELRAVRQRNLKILEIDEEMESFVGQFAKKWEVKKAEASPHLHNLCSLSGCRAIKVRLDLRKPSLTLSANFETSFLDNCIANLAATQPSPGAMYFLQLASYLFSAAHSAKAMGS